MSQKHGLVRQPKVDPRRRCGSGGCVREAVCLVAQSGRIRSVCGGCADEMTVLYGWRRIGGRR